MTSDLIVFGFVHALHFLPHPLGFVHMQDGDIIAPELTPLKASWCNNDGEDGDDGGSQKTNRALVNGHKKAKTKLF